MVKNVTSTEVAIEPEAMLWLGKLTDGAVDRLSVGVGYEHTGFRRGH